MVILEVPLDFIFLKIKLKIGIVFGKYDLMVEKRITIYIFCYFCPIFLNKFLLPYPNFECKKVLRTMGKKGKYNVKEKI